ncbi:MAG: DUF2799 domain-containing protein [Pseudomonadota bacterium]
MRYLALAAVLTLTGCAAKPSITANQCAAGDWQTIGYADAAKGLAKSRLLAHQDACGTHGIVPDRRAYMGGWEEGIATYCTADNGFALGRRGARRNTVCAGDLAEPFTAAYTDGWQLYQAHRVVNQLQRELAHLERREQELDYEIKGAKLAQIDPDLTVQERLQLLSDLDSLLAERDDIRSALPRVRAELANKQDELDAVTQLLASS